MIKKYILPGLLVWLPILGTFYIIKFIVELLDRSLTLLPESYQPQNIFGFHIPGLGVIFSILILFLTGLLVKNIVGRKLVHYWDQLVESVPLVRGIHSAIKQITQVFLKPENEAFHKVLLLEYPRRGIWAIAFMTDEGFKGVPHEEDMVTVFLPTTPNPTSGFLAIVPRRDTVEIDMSIDEAFKLVISLGVITPESVRGENHKGPTEKNDVLAKMAKDEKGKMPDKKQDDQKSDKQ